MELGKPLFEKYAIDPLAEVNSVALSWDDILTLAEDDLCTIGAHTTSHPVFRNLSAPEVLVEIVGNIEKITEKLGTPPKHFAYPFGGSEEISRRDVNIVQQTGLTSAVTTQSANIFRAHRDHLFSLPRIAVGSSMNTHTLDLIRHGVIPMIRNKGTRVVKL